MHRLNCRSRGDCPGLLNRPASQWVEENVREAFKSQHGIVFLRPNQLGTHLVSHSAGSTLDEYRPSSSLGKSPVSEWDPIMLGSIICFTEMI